MPKKKLTVVQFFFVVNVVNQKIMLASTAKPGICIYYKKQILHDGTKVFVLTFTAKKKRNPMYNFACPLCTLTAKILSRLYSFFILAFTAKQNCIHFICNEKKISGHHSLLILLWADLKNFRFCLGLPLRASFRQPDTRHFLSLRWGPRRHRLCGHSAHTWGAKKARESSPFWPPPPPMLSTADPAEGRDYVAVLPGFGPPRRRGWSSHWGCLSYGAPCGAPFG